MFPAAAAGSYLQENKIMVGYQQTADRTKLAGKQGFHIQEHLAGQIFSSGVKGKQNRAERRVKIGIEFSMVVIVCQ